jgi:hypothetical protein
LTNGAGGGFGTENGVLVLTLEIAQEPLGLGGFTGAVNAFKDDKKGFHRRW